MLVTFDEGFIKIKTLYRKMYTLFDLFVVEYRFKLKFKVFNTIRLDICFSKISGISPLLCWTRKLPKITALLFFSSTNKTGRQAQAFTS